MSTSSTAILVFKYHLQLKGMSSFGKWLISRARKVQNEPITSYGARKQASAQKVIGICQKDIENRSYLERTPTVQTGSSLSIRVIKVVVCNALSKIVQESRLI